MNHTLSIVCLNIHGCVCGFFPAVCSGEITDSAGVVLSPNWPEAYDKGQDCIWGIHVEEDKRIMLDIQVYVSTFMYSLICLLTLCPLICMKPLQTLSLASLNLIITKPISSPVLTHTPVPDFKPRHRSSLKITKSYLTMTGKTH